MRFLFYSHDGLGLGHTRRHLAVATALCELAPEASILLATGADDVNRLGLPSHIEVLKLPGLRKVANDQYASRRLRMPSSEIRSLRAALLSTAVKGFQPSVVLVDKHPFGVSGELRGALSHLRRAGGRAVLGLRDILDDRATILKEWAPHNLQKRIARHFDRVLVYGHQAIFDPTTQYDFPKELRQRTHFCGYVVNEEKEDARAELDRAAFDFPVLGGKPIVLATAGGGEDGFHLLETFLRAAAGASWQGVAVAGPMEPDQEFDKLRRLARESKVILRSFVPSLSRLFPSVATLVCMGGYNTLAEAVCHGARIVCVPRTMPRAEQLIRAQSFERLGLLKAIPPDELEVGGLREAIEKSIGCAQEERRKKSMACLNFDGAREAARQLLSLAGAAADVKNQARLTLAV